MDDLVSNELVEQFITKTMQRFLLEIIPWSNKYWELFAKIIIIWWKM